MFILAGITSPENRLILSKHEFIHRRRDDDSFESGLGLQYYLSRLVHKQTLNESNLRVRRKYTRGKRVR